MVGLDAGKLKTYSAMKEERVGTLLTLLNLKGIGPSFIGKNAKAIFEASNNDYQIKKIIGLLTKKDYNSDEIKEAEESAELIQNYCSNNEIKIISLFDNEYPSVLENLKAKFPILYSSANLQSKLKVGIIGSRKAREIASTIAGRIGEFCVHNNMQIINGIADGIDVASMESLKDKKQVIGVIPGGLAIEDQKTLSKSYLNNAKIILEGGGCLISQFKPFERQDRYKVVEYCKFQAAMSDALVLVQSSLDGGSRFTVEQFCKEEKTLFIVNTAEYDPSIEEYSANKLIIDKRQAGIAEWCDLPINKVKCKVEIINSKEDYNKISSLMDSHGEALGLF
jgi:DNA processing protein